MIERSLNHNINNFFKMDFNAALAFPAVVMDPGYNGATSTLDILAPVDYIDSVNKIVVSDANVMDLGRSISNAIHDAQGAPAGAVAVTAIHVAAAIKRIGVHIAMHTILALLHAAGVEITLRSSDVYTINQYDDKLGPGRDAIGAATGSIYAYLLNDTDAMTRTCRDAKFVALAIICCAIHRAKHEGHNFLTDLARRNKTDTYRSLFVAGADKEGFTDFMERIGHDVWHCLSNQSMIDAANAMTGEVEALVSVHHLYNGENVQGEAVHRILALTEAARDRWPIGNIGVSALIVGLTLLDGVGTEMKSKIIITGMDDYSNVISQLKEYLSETDLDRETILRLKNVLGPAIAAAYGFCDVNATYGDMAGGYESLKSFVKNYAVQTITGATLAKRWRDVNTDPAAVSALAQNFLAIFATTIANPVFNGILVSGYTAPLSITLP